MGAGPALADDGPGDTAALRDRLRTTMWELAGPIRTGTGLQRCLDALAGIAEALGPPAHDPTQLELHNAVVVGRAIAAGALLREETRGGHVRDDHPRTDPCWSSVHTERTTPV